MTSKQRARKQRAFDRLCYRLSTDLGAWTFSQRNEYMALSKQLNKSISDEDTLERVKIFSSDRR
jgi:hypothetical protein